MGVAGGGGGVQREERSFLGVVEEWLDVICLGASRRGWWW